MSDSATIDPAAEAHVADEIVEEGGSPDESTRADGEGEGSADTNQSSGADGASTTPDEVVTSAQEELAELRAELAHRNGILDELNDRMERDPALRKMLSESGGGTSQDKDAVSHFEKVLNDEFTPEAAAALRKVLSPIIQEHAQLKKEVGGTRSRVAGMARTVGASKFRGALEENGVAASVQSSKQFQRHLKVMRARPEFQRLEARSPQFAAEMAAGQWTASRARANGWKGEQSRVATAKTGRSGNAPARGSASSEKVIQIKKVRGGGHVDRAAEIRFKAQEAGKPVPQIRYID